MRSAFAYAAQLIVHGAAHGALTLLHLLPIFVALMALEIVAPCLGSRPSWPSRVRALTFWAVYLPLASAAAALVVAPIAALNFRPLLTAWAVPGAPPIVSFIAGGLAAVVVGDLAYYWLHRFQHQFLWRFHAVHHSVREMSGVTAYHHVSELPIQALFYGLPVGLFFLVPDPTAVPFFAAMAAAWGHIIHSPVALPWPRWLVDNRFHRIHHSLEPQHWDRNFGVLLPWWDRMFGTAFEPGPEEWPDVGVPEFGELRSISAFVLIPFARLEAKVTRFSSEPNC